MNEITLALTRFWQNKQISLPPMSTLLIAAGIISEQEDAGILCSYLTHWMQTGAVTWQRLSGRSFSLHFEELQAGATPCEQALWNALCALVGEKRTATGKQLLQWSKCWEHSAFSGTAERAAVLCMNGI